MKIVSVIGARPQFVKAAIVSQAIRTYNDTQAQSKINEFIVHTGQHYDEKMSGIFLKELSIDVDINLNVMEKTHARMTAAMLIGIEDVLLKQKPDAILVYGDTNSTLAASLAAIKLKIPIGHVEAGLRSFNMQMPEETNRILTDKLSTWLFCPTQTAVFNLENEGIDKNSDPQPHKSFAQYVYWVGDVMYDAFKLYQKHACCSQELKPLMADIKNGYYLTSVHREENVDNPIHLQDIFQAFEKIAQTKTIVLPAHPRTLKRLRSFGISAKHIKMISPVSYFDMLYLLKNCEAVITDSGGLQKEAFFMQKPCITLREETEWVELVQHGVNMLAGSNPKRILDAESQLSSMDFKWDINMYGNGDAGKKIVECLVGKHAKNPKKMCI